MAEANEVGSGEIEHISLQVAGIQRDLLQRFFSGNHPPRKIKMETEDEELEQEEDEIELSLGLSLNGRFGVDPVKAGKLTRSSSISDFFLTSARSSGGGTWMRPSECTEAPLARTCSLPAETEEWRRRRKELQCLRRMEAKRKRDEKQRVSRNDGVYCSNDNGDKRGEIVNGVMGESRRPLGMSNWGRGMEPERPISLDRRRGGSSCGEAEAPPSSLQGSNGSPGSVSGSGSSLVSDYDSQMARDMNKNIEARSPNSVQSLPQQKEQKPSATPGNSPSKKLLGGEIRTKETIVRNVIEDMLCVSTIGDGPNGKRIEGFLYRYKKGEEVRIVCVCHGTFLSPAEFVKHAGGGDVAHPLKHIVVNTTSFL